MRVVADTSQLRRPHTGVARWVTGLLDALEQVRGFDVIRAGGPRRVGGGLLLRPVNFTLQRSWYTFGIRRAARRWRADALLMPAGYAAGRGRVPQLVVIPDVNFLTEPGTYDPVLARYAAWALRKAAHDANALVTISSFSRSEISRHLHVAPEHINVVYPGLEPPIDGDYSSPIDGPYALYVGATQVHKNLGLLLDAWPNMPKDLKLAIVGQPGRDHARISERAARLDGRVIVTGRVSQERLEAWYRNAAVFVFPSLTEGFGYPPLEAMQRGVPVVASSAASLPEVLGDAAGYHDPRDPAAVVKEVKAILSDEGLRVARIRKGRERAAQYTWTRAAGQMADLLDGLLGHA